MKKVWIIILALLVSMAIYYTQKNDIKEEILLILQNSEKLKTNKVVFNTFKLDYDSLIYMSQYCYIPAVEKELKLKISHFNDFVPENEYWIILIKNGECVKRSNLGSDKISFHLNPLRIYSKHDTMVYRKYLSYQIFDSTYNRIMKVQRAGVY